MQLEDVYKTIQSTPHSHSGYGMSHWEKAARCGRRANLEAQHKERMAEIRAEEAEENEGDDALSIGTYYHALMELELRGQLSDEVWDQTDETLDPNFLEAVRLFRGYKGHWASPLARWGASLVGVEYPLGAAGQTGRADAVFHIADTSIAYENTGLLLPEPGVYIMDWKTGKAKSAADQWRFGFGNQSINYLMLARAQHPEWDVKGIIFDKIIRHKVLRKTPEMTKDGTKEKAGPSYYAYLAQYQPGDEQAVEGLIQIGRRNMQLNLANPATCFDGAYPCPMFKLALCRRY